MIFIKRNHRASSIPESFLDFGQLFVNDCIDFVLIRKNGTQLTDFGQQLLVLVLNFFTFQPCQALQTHIQNGLRLLIA
ncbi:Uncharacterised protein [Mycobacterium tuberculosis]|nr:Uncharacterised protein [Mycobacterium tuberculosis]